MSKGESHLEERRGEQSVLDMFRAAMDASPHGIALRKGDVVLYSNPAWNVLMTAQRVDGSERPASNRDIRTSSYGFSYQDALLTLTLAHDVSERKKTERQLQEAQKLEALGRWVGGVVHDFNNLLTAIMLYSDMVGQAAQPDSTAARYNEEIRAVAKRGAGLTGQLLSFLQRRPHERTVISANSLLKGLRDVIERMIGEDVEVLLELAPEACLIELDPAQMQQLVFNLILNARDAMSEGGTLTITTREASADLGNGPQNCMALVISDTGCGMDEATRALIFDPFFTTKPEGKGTGLGLTTVRDIVAEAGGVVAVESEVGIGTVVTVTLPCAERLPTREPSLTLSTDITPNSETILVVEDDPAVRSSIVRTLSQCGYNILQAGSGNEALAIAREFSGEVHLLIADLVLPGMSGRDLARRLVQARPVIRVLFVSGYGAPTDSFSNEIIFEKPFNTEALVTRVRQALEPGITNPR